MKSAVNSMITVVMILTLFFAREKAHAQSHAIALKSISNNNYVGVNHANYVVVRSDYRADMDSCRFQIQDNGDGTFTLKNLLRSKYICALQQGSDRRHMVVEDDPVDLRLIDVGYCEVAIQVYISSDGKWKYIKADSDGELVANWISLDNATKFRVEYTRAIHPSKIVALKQDISNYYVGINHVNFVVVANDDYHRPEMLHCHFRMQDNGDGTFYLKNIFHNKYVSALQEGSDTGKMALGNVPADLKLIDKGDNQVVIQMLINGTWKYVKERKWELIAFWNDEDTATRFTIEHIREIPPPKMIALKSDFNDDWYAGINHVNYVVVTPDHGPEMLKCRFWLQDNGDGTFILKNVLKDKYVGAVQQQGSEQGHLVLGNVPVDLRMVDNGYDRGYNQVGLQMLVEGTWRYVKVEDWELVAKPDIGTINEAASFTIEYIPELPPPRIVALKSGPSGCSNCYAGINHVNYVVVARAHRPEMDSCRFQIQDNGDGTFHFRSLSTDKYVCARQQDPDKAHMALGDVPADIKLFNVGNNRVAFQILIDGEWKYVKEDDWELVADQDSEGKATWFTIEDIPELPPPRIVALKSGPSGCSNCYAGINHVNYVVVARDHRPDMDSCRFRMQDNGDGTFHFRSLSTDKYVCARQQDPDKAHMALGDVPADIKLFNVGNNRVAFQMLIDGEWKYVKEDHWELVADEDFEGEATGFTIEYIYHGIRPVDSGGRLGLRNPERGFRTEAMIAGPAYFPEWGIPHPVSNRQFAHENDKWAADAMHYQSDGLTVVQAFCYLNEFSNGKNITRVNKLDELDTSLAKVREKGLKAVLVFSYIYEGGRAGPTADTVLKHLDQLAPIIHANKDIILVMPAGFVGAYGEWDYQSNEQISTLKDDEDLDRIVDKILRVLPQIRMTQVRCPRYKRWVLDVAKTPRPWWRQGEWPQSEWDYHPSVEDYAYSDENVARIGFFHHGFLGYHDDGTTPGGEHGTWCHDLQVDCIEQDEFDYMTMESPYVMVDGELVWGDDKGWINCDRVDGSQAALRMRLHHQTTFSIAHGHSEDARRVGKLDKVLGGMSIDNWKKLWINQGMLLEHRMPISDGYFRGFSDGVRFLRSEFEYIRDHMGYRLELQRATFPRSIAQGEDLDIDLLLINRGFSTIHNPRPVYSVLLSSTGDVLWASVSANPREWQPYDPADPLYRPLVHEIRIRCIPHVPPGRYKLGLWLPDQDESIRYDSRYAIRLANRDIEIWQDNKFLLNIFGAIEVLE